MRGGRRSSPIPVIGNGSSYQERIFWTKRIPRVGNEELKYTMIPTGGTCGYEISMAKETNDVRNPGSGGEPDPAISAVELCITAVSGTLQLCVTAVSRRAARGPRGPSYGFTT